MATAVESFKLSDSSIISNRLATADNAGGSGWMDARGPSNGSKRSNMELRQLALLLNGSPFDSRKSKSDGFKITEGVERKETMVNEKGDRYS